MAAEGSNALTIAARQAARGVGSLEVVDVLVSHLQQSGVDPTPVKTFVSAALVAAAAPTPAAPAAAGNNNANNVNNTNAAAAGGGGGDAGDAHKRAVVSRLLLASAKHDAAATQTALQEQFPQDRAAGVLIAGVFMDKWLQTAAAQADVRAQKAAAQCMYLSAAASHKAQQQVRDQQLKEKKTTKDGEAADAQ